MRSARLFVPLFTVALGLSVAGCGSSAGAAPPKVPMAPYRVGATPHGTPTTGGVKLGWQDRLDGGSRITGHVVTPFKAGVAQKPITLVGGPNATIITPLPNGARYQFSVAAVNAVGTSPRSPLSPPVVVGTPGQPMRAGINKGGYGDVPLLGPGAVWLTLNRPGPRPNGGPILHMDARCSAKTGRTRTQRLNSDGTRTKITGLTPGAYYACSVAATNKYGSGPRSKRSNFLEV